MREENMTPELLNEYRRVAYYYYKVGLTQEAIAKRMQMSRQRVNRIVSACVKLGIVKISVEGLEQCYLELETSLEQKYGIREVRIVENELEEDLIQDLGMEAARYLKSIVNDGDVLGVTRGRTTSAMVKNMSPARAEHKDITITQLIGSTREMGNEIGVDKIVYQLAEKLNAKESVLYAPVIVHKPEMKNAFMTDPYFLDTYETIKKCDVAIVGIGTAHSQWKHMISLFDENDEEQTKWAKDVVGEVCTHFFDKNGNEIDPPFRNRIISIESEDYKKIPVKIGIAGGEGKTEAISASMKGGYINVLITDEKTARKLMET